MSFLDAMKLQECLTKEKSISIRVNEKLIHFVPPWPRKLVWVHVNDSYGGEFPSIPSMKCNNVDTCLLWIVCGMISSVTELWESTVDSIVRDTQWNGCLLAFLSRKCFPRLYLHPSRKNPFSKQLSIMELHKRLNGSGQIFFENQRIAQLFHHHQPYVLVLEIQDNFIDYIRRKILPHNKVIVVFCSLCTMTIIDQLPDMFHISAEDGSELSYKLCFVATSNTNPNNLSIDAWSGMLYMRHVKEHFDGWWKKSQEGDIVKSKNGIDSIDWSSYDSTVFVNATNPKLDSLRDRYLSYIGSQSQAVCSQHHFPLITAPNCGKSRKCAGFYSHDSVADGPPHASCNNSIALECPVSFC